MVYDAARAAVFMNRRDTEPYVRWCGRTVRFQPSPPTRSTPPPQFVMKRGCHRQGFHDRL